MKGSPTVGLSHAVLAIPLVAFVVGTPGGPTWASGDASLAVYLERTAAAPLYGLLATLAAYLPVGEPGFRLGLLDAILAACVVAGVIRAARALLPKDPVAGIVGGVLLAISPAFRETAGPSLLAAAGLVWTLAALIELARGLAATSVSGASTGQPETSAARAALAAFAGVTVVIGSAPWLGVVLAIAAVAAGGRALSSRTLAIVLGAIGATIAALWSTAVGRLPDLAPGLASVVEAGRGAGAVALGAGLLGTAFAAVTGLALASRLAIVAALVAVHAIATGRDGTALLAVLAVGAAVLPVAIVRATRAERRHVIAALAGVPLVLAAALTGPRLAPDDPRDAPARLASDVIGRLPPGPGVVLATRTTTWTAITYAQSVAGARPDLALAAFPPTDLVAADALRNDRIVGSDVPAFGRVDPTRAFPRGRGFQFLAARPDMTAPVAAPADYASRTGEIEATLLALARARFEAGNGRLDAAARAAGLVAADGRGRFRAADLAVLATTAPSRDRPAMFAFVPPMDETRPGRWMLELFGDDLAWVAGIEAPVVDAPRERKLHALWRQIWRGELGPDDPAIAALGPTAVAATREMLTSLKPAAPTPATPAPAPR